MGQRALRPGAADGSADERLDVGARLALKRALSHARGLRELAAAALVAAAVLAMASTVRAAPAAPRPFPPGFPAPLYPPDNPSSPAKIALGERLFFDTRLSSTGRYACASCHAPERAFTDGRALAQGATGAALRRNAMALANVAWNAGFNWASSEIRSLEEQLLRPLLGEHPVEMGMKGREDALIAQLAADRVVRGAFDAAFPDERAPVTLQNLARAIATYERSLVSAGSPFDRYVFADERTAMSPAALRGMSLFFSSRTRCAECHSGILFGGPVRSAATPHARPIYANTGLYEVDGQGGYPAEDQGLKEVTGLDADNGRFRVPSLRDIALTAPYMHDGSIATLAEVIDHYDRGGRARRDGALAPLRDERIRPLGLSTSEKLDLEAFLRSLTGDGVPARLPPDLLRGDAEEHVPVGLAAGHHGSQTRRRVCHRLASVPGAR